MRRYSRQPLVVRHLFTQEELAPHDLHDLHDLHEREGRPLALTPVIRLTRLAGRLSLLLYAFTLSSLAAPPPLRQIATVHHLSKEQAERHPSVDVTGVVTAFSGFGDLFFLQDATGGIAADRNDHTLVHVGDRIHVEGVAGPGHFASSLTINKLRVIGRSKLPRAHLFTFEDLQGGLQDSQWIAVHGTVRAAKVETHWTRPTLVLQMQIGGGPIAIHLIEFNPGDAERLVDSVITARGVCGTVFNEKRQFTGVRLFAQNMSNITVDEPTPADPFAVPTRPIDSVLQFAPNSRPGHRVKVAGTVTLQNPGHSLFIQDGNAGIELLTEQRTRLPLGARIEAIGFPEQGAFSPLLRGTTFRLLTVDAPPSPTFVGKDGLLRQIELMNFVPLENRLIHLDGQALDATVHPTEYVLPLRAGREVVLAVLNRESGRENPLALAHGTMVGITGVLTVELDANREPRYFRVLLRSANDVVVLKRASWWTPVHLAVILVAAFAGILCVLLWVVTLRRRVRQQTAQLRESEERFRHLAQTDSLTGLANRAFFHERLGHAIGNADTTRSAIGLIMVDLDFFKQVNDSLGHHAGDELLCFVATRLRGAVRKTDLVARLGGDEFVVLLQPLDPQADLAALGSMVIHAICAPAAIAGKSFHVSASIGVCAYPQLAADLPSLLQNADTAMYRAKASGRNSFAVFEPVGSLSKGPALAQHHHQPADSLKPARRLETSAPLEKASPALR